ncbi:hypothetical protein ABZS88_32490 [Streptomyces sp. NPDC005480]|uniref:hypothetical protein n=1 Tax=Streptomyces sp. NPDC005480 TaxID=3154880 RepID=UPI0033AB9C7F
MSASGESSMTHAPGRGTLTVAAERLTEQMRQPAKIYNFGGKDNTYEERDVDEPPTMDKKALIIAATAARPCTPATHSSPSPSRSSWRRPD